MSLAGIIGFFIIAQSIFMVCIWQCFHKLSQSLIPLTEILNSVADGIWKLHGTFMEWGEYYEKTLDVIEKNTGQKDNLGLPERKWLEC